MIKETYINDQVRVRLYEQGLGFKIAVEQGAAWESGSWYYAPTRENALREFDAMVTTEMHYC